MYKKNYVTDKVDIYQRVTDKIVETIETTKLMPWQRPWQECQKINYVSRKAYKGINWLLLDGGEYLTFKQLVDNNGKFVCDAKGKGQTIVFWKFSKFETKKSDGSIEEKTVPFCKYSTVFNINLTNLESKIKLNDHHRENIAMDFQYENQLQGLNCKSLSDKACYSPTLDVVTLPKIEQFKSVSEFYSVKYHELIHSTGHSSRLNRELSGLRMDKSSYSFEELIAEIGAAMLMAYNEIDIDFSNTATYIQGWASNLKADNHLIVKAASAAQRAVDYILSFEGVETQEESED